MTLFNTFQFIWTILLGMYWAYTLYPIVINLKSDNAKDLAWSVAFSAANLIIFIINLIMIFK